MLQFMGSRYGRVIPVFALILGCLTPRFVQARDMHGRLGLGYNREFSNSAVPGGVPGISLKYGVTRDIAMSLILGVSTATPTNSVVGTKFFKNIFYETNLNFYFMLGAAMVSGNNHTGYDVISGFGAEFFIPGIESLGFSVETGGSFSNIEGHPVLKTIGVSFLDAGIHFYF